jgi:hypothetical protein
MEVTHCHTQSAGTGSHMIESLMLVVPSRFVPQQGTFLASKKRQDSDRAFVRRDQAVMSRELVWFCQQSCSVFLSIRNQEDGNETIFRASVLHRVLASIVLLDRFLALNHETFATRKMSEWCEECNAMQYMYSFVYHDTESTPCK